MRFTNLQKLLALALVFTFALAACQTGTPVSPLSATFKEVSGTVSIKAAGQSDYVKVTGNESLEENGSVQTGEDGRVRLDLSTGTIVRLSPSSLFTLVSNQQTEGGLSTKFKLDLGQIFIILKGGSMSVETPSGVASVRGSYMMVEVDPVTQDVYVTCLEGDCGANNDAGGVDFSDGQKTILFHRDPATGQYTAPEIGLMTPEDFQKWLDSCPECRDIMNQAYATMTAMAATEPPATEPPAEPTATLTPVPETGGGGACLNIIGPLGGSQLPWQGPVTFAWEGQPDAAKYILTFHYPNGKNVQFETSETNITRYTETMYDGGAYSWDVTAIGKDGNKICQTDQVSFSKPSSDPGVPEKEKPPVCTTADGDNPDSPCFCGLEPNYWKPWCVPATQSPG